MPQALLAATLGDAARWQSLSREGGSIVFTTQIGLLCAPLRVESNLSPTNGEVSVLDTLLTSLLDKTLPVLG
ncbi:MAG: hypothetical protein V7K92_04470 [Nostoc sp.]|uniref:hypothetical protein n=1 Tax=Nostoc sp. TaxID=1180 RepID=UPI002FEF1AAE